MIFSRFYAINLNGFSPLSFDLPTTASLLVNIGNLLLPQNKDKCNEEIEIKELPQMMITTNKELRVVIDEILNLVYKNNVYNAYFLDVPGGSEKTLIYLFYLQLY